MCQFIHSPVHPLTTLLPIHSLTYTPIYPFTLVSLPTFHPSCHFPVHLFTHLFTCVSSHSCTRPPVHPFISPSVYLFANLFNHLPIHPSIHIHIYTSTVHCPPSIHPPFQLYIYPSIQPLTNHLSVSPAHLSLQRPVYPTIYPSIYLSSGTHASYYTSGY